MKIGSKLKLSFATVILCTIGIAGTGIYEARAINSLLEKDLDVSVKKLEHAQTMEKLATAGGFTGIASLKVTDEYDIKRFRQFLAEAASGALVREKEMEKLINKSDSREVQKMKEMLATRHSFEEKINTAINNRDNWGQTKTNEYVRDVIMPEWDKYQKELGDFVNYYNENIQATQKNIIEAGQRNSVFMGIMLALAVIISVILSFKITSSIVNSLNRAASLSKDMAEGKFNHNWNGVEFPKDETGQLLSSMSQMEGNIRQIIQNIGGNAHNLLGLADNLTERNLQLSSRTEQQAASIEETAATIEELSTAISQNASNSKDVAKLSQDISVSAQNGVVMVKNVVDKMSSIKDSSDKISQITSMIDTIAFQTNILALNAAVEAARAGEQGRGFAVVASEVRVLSQKSAQAAKDIKALIEVSSNQVQEGNSLANEVAEQIVKVVDGFKTVNELIGQITSSTNEQSHGVKQIHEAVSQIDTVTQHNATLVEESARAAEELVAQGQNLEQSVSLFQV